MTDQAPHPDASTRTETGLTGLVGLVHDINQMLTVITGRAGLLLARNAAPEQARDLRAIVLAADDAAAMLRRLRDPAAAAATDGPGTALRRTVDQVRQLCWPVEAAESDYRNEVADTWWTPLPAQLLREVLANLVLNAAAVLPPGGRITFTATGGRAGRVLLRVADDGRGLPADDPESVFGFGVSGSGRPGRGVGLSQCRDLLEQSGAALRASNAERGGAVFELDLPARRGPSDAPAETASETEAPGQPMDVLVVDDEEVVRDMLRDVLEAWGCRVQCHRDGQSALAAYAPGAATVALIDRNLPGLAGTELAGRLRVADPLLAIVIMSGWQAADAAATEPPAAVDLEVDKPLALEEIRAALDEGRRLHETRRESGRPT